jgi:hypothetical protein
MTVRMSTGLREAILEELRTTTLNDAVLYLFGGSQPANANDSEASNTVIAIITVDGGSFVGGSPTNGLAFGAITSDEPTKKSTMPKHATDVWKGEALVTGTITWGRLYANALTQGSSTSAVRLDGTASTASTSDFVVSSVNAVAGVDVVVTQMNVTLTSN